jgi:hypothetical protein
MKLHKATDGRLLFYCPGCECHHAVTDSWQFNGDFNEPTISPSILVRSTKMTEKGLADYEEWCNAGYPKRNGEPFENIPTVCHSFITNGKFQFLNDCTHSLAGQIVDLPEFE